MSRVTFGISLSTSAAPDADPVGDARHAEDLGFDFLTVSDHLQGTHDTYETWTELTWVAAGTERIGLFPNVLGLPYRHPPVVAKMAESLDRLSGGRLNLGLGAGGFEREFRGFGLPFGSGAERLAALEEAIEIIRRMWREPTVSHQGRHYVTDEAQIEPKAARTIPIYLGVYGPRALALTGRLADGWSVSRASPEELLAMYAAVRRASEAAGRPADAVAVNYNVGVFVSDRARPNGPGVVGTVDEVVERLRALLAVGLASMTFSPLGDERTQRERIAHDVIPRLREV